MKIKKIILLLPILGVLSCNRKIEKKPLTLEEKISIRDSIAAEKISQISHDEHIKDTITGTWNYYECCPKGTSEEAFSIKLKKNNHNDSITGNYYILTQKKKEQGPITGYIIGKKAVAEFYKNSGSSKDKGTIELIDWNKKPYGSIKINLLKAPAQPSFFPKTFILRRQVPREIRRNE